MADQKQKQDTTVTWANGGDEQIVLNSLANGSAAMGDEHDFGATFPLVVAVEAQVQHASSPTDGKVNDVYWAWSVDGGTYVGEVPGTAGKLAAARRNRLDYVGSLYCTNDAGTQHEGWAFPLPARYGLPVLYNDSGQALSASGTGMWIRITPLIGDVT